MISVPGMSSQQRFTWQDGERTIRFGRGIAAEAVGVLGGPGYALLTTPRARGAAPEVVEAAAAVVEVGPGRVDELAGDLLGTIDQEFSAFSRAMDMLRTLEEEFERSMVPFEVDELEAQVARIRAESRDYSDVA